jgi:hypothetical protein
MPAGHDDCFRMFNPVTLGEFEEVLGAWTAATLALPRALRAHPGVALFLAAPRGNATGATAALGEGGGAAGALVAAEGEAAAATAGGGVLNAADTGAGQAAAAASGGMAQLETADAGDGDGGAAAAAAAHPRLAKAARIAAALQAEARTPSGWLPLGRLLGLLGVMCALGALALSRLRLRYLLTRCGLSRRRVVRRA